MRRIPVYKLKLVRAGAAYYPADSFGLPQVAGLLFHRLIGSADREHTAALFLNTVRQPTGCTIIGVGILNRASMHPREVFKSALLANAHSIILAHNHPSGCATPSPEDLLVTQRIVRLGNLMGVPIRDHIVVAHNGYSSMREMGVVTFPNIDPGERTPALLGIDRVPKS